MRPYHNHDFPFATMRVEFITPNLPRWAALLHQSSHDIYHLPGYMALEAQRTQTLPQGLVISEGDRTLLVPYLLRSGETLLLDEANTAEVFDVVSPYGYPGLILSQSAQEHPAFLTAALHFLKQSLREAGVCSAFFRLHPILNQGWSPNLPETEYRFQGETVSLDLTLPPTRLWNHIRKDHRNRINRAKREGLTVTMMPWSEALPTFIDIYTETMGRVGAASHYLEFDADYFAQLGETLGDRLHLCLVESEGTVASAGLYTEWNGIVQAIFGGTRTAFLKQSPSTLETYCVALWAKDRGNRLLHLGGGVGASQDPLFRYKAGFSQLRHPFYTLRLVTDAVKYRELVQRRAKVLNLAPEALLQSHYFPAYRAAIGA